MKSSPKAGDIPPLTGSKTPVSGKKLVQARLPFKTLGGSEPPLTTKNDTPNAALTTANTSTPVTDMRKRRQSSTTTKDDGVRASKLNRCEYESHDDIVLETSEAMELSNDIPMADEIEDEAKSTLNRSSESKENICIEEEVADKAAHADSRNDTIETVESAKMTPKAKQSLEFEEKKSEPRKSKRINDLITIKLPMTKKAKGAAKKAKKHKNSDPSIEASNEDQIVEKNPDNADVDVDMEEPADDVKESLENESTLISDDDDDDVDGDDDGDLNESVLNKSCNLNDSLLSNVSEQNSTPAKHPLTPKQIQRLVESEKKKQEKDRAKIERERKLQEEKDLRQREKEEREQQKKREREEKDEQRKKEKEMREQKLLEEKLEKQREKEMKEQQRKIEREEKEEQKKREKEERDLQKKKEREEKEREREEDRKKREVEKQQKIEAEQNKNRKTVEAFVKFFVPKKVENKLDSNECDESMDTDQLQQTFMSFQVKDDMILAPITRRTLNYDERSNFDHLISSDVPSSDLYLLQLKNNNFVPRKTARTWQDDVDEKCSNGDDLFVIEEDGENVQVLKEEPKKMHRAKFFKFSENRRPPYYGTWRKKSNKVRPRYPLGLDSQMDYEIDSDDEWEEEEPGESLHGSDDEKEVESDDEYEIDNDVFVPHGHLSDEELQDEDESDFNNQENQKFKLKLAQNELEDERKKKTQKLKPRLIGLIWQNSDGTKPDNCSNGVWELMNKHAMLFLGPTVKVERPISQQAENSDDENSNDKKSLGVRRLQIGEKEIPDLIRLINGNQNNAKFLVKEFCAYLAKNHQPHREYSGASIKAKIKELARWQACPEEGRMFKKMCWYVPIATRKRYDLNELNFPNNWSYTIPPRRPIEVTDVADVNAENKETEKKTDQPDIIALSDDSNSCSLSETLTPDLIKRTANKRTNYNIAKFIRPLTEDEKKKQFEPLTLHRRPSDAQPLDDEANESISSSLQTTEDKGNIPRAKKRVSTTSTGASAPKKRINLLMSGPVGQELSPKLKTTLVTQFLSTNLRKRKTTDTDDANNATSSNTAGTSDGAKKTKLNDSVIVID